MNSITQRITALTLVTSLLAVHCAAPSVHDSADAASQADEEALTQSADLKKVKTATSNLRAAEKTAIAAAAAPFQVFAKEVTTQKGSGAAVAMLLSNALDGTALTAALRRDAARELVAVHGKAIDAALAARGDAALRSGVMNALSALGEDDVLARTKAAAQLSSVLTAKGVIDKATNAKVAALSGTLGGARSRFGELIVLDASAALLASLISTSVALPDGKATALIIPLIVLGVVLFGLFAFFPWATQIPDYCTQAPTLHATGAWWGTWPGTAPPDSHVRRTAQLSPAMVGAYSDVNDSGSRNPSACLTASFDIADSSLPQVEVPLSNLRAIAHAHAVGANYARARNDWSLTLRDVEGVSHCSLNRNIDQAIADLTSAADVDASGWPSSLVLSCSLDHDLPAGRYHVLVCTTAATYTGGGSAWADSLANVGAPTFRRCPTP